MIFSGVERSKKILVGLFLVCCLPLDLISPPRRSAVNANVRRVRLSRAAKPAVGSRSCTLPTSQVKCTPLNHTTRPKKSGFGMEKKKAGTGGGVDYIDRGAAYFFFLGEKSRPRIAPRPGCTTLVCTQR